jgi:outer membrane immunogenic protein
MRYTFAILLSSVAIESAVAADLPQAPPPTRAPVQVLPTGYNWSGFYIGVMGGGGWSTSQGVDFKGGFAGGTIGANAQFSNFVLGGELEAAWSDIGQTASTLFGLVSATDKIQAFGSAAVRAGFAIDNLLLYGKGGFAAANNNLKVSALGFTVSDTQTHLGYTVGAGLEYGFTPNLSAKVEYLWASYQSKNYFANLLPPGAPSGTFDVHTVKFGLNYRFGWGGPVVAKY